MQIRDYYHNNFKDDLLKLLPDTGVPYFGHTWQHDCGNLNNVDSQSRAAFLVCLYFTVLVDQAMHAHFTFDYPKFEELTRYPKFCHGLAQFHKNPRDILYVPVKKGLVNHEDLESLLRPGMELFIDEVIDFFQSHISHIKPEVFFKKLIYDPDVQIPLIFIPSDESLKKEIVYKAYETLRNTAKDRLSSLNNSKNEVFEKSDFSDMDTSTYWNHAEKFLPKKIDILFIAESPPAFRGDTPVSYFYFVHNHGGDILFATLVKALINKTYTQNPDLKRKLLKTLQNEKKSFLMDAVQYPINRDRNWDQVPDPQREEIIRDNEENLFKRLKTLEEEGYIYSKTRIILIKSTVYNTLYDSLREDYNILNQGHIGFPRYYRDPLFVNKVRNLLIAEGYECIEKMNALE